MFGAEELSATHRSSDYFGRMVDVRFESLATRRLRLFSHTGVEMGTGSGFVVYDAAKGRHLLFSNRHVLAGLKPNNEYMWQRELPTSVEVLFPSTADYTVPVSRRFDLLDSNNEALYLQHPVLGYRADIVALPLPADPDVHLLPVQPIGHWRIQRDGLETHIPVELSPADIVFVVGFPLGYNGGSETLSIWTQAAVASEPALDLDGVARFLVDGATRSGLSGAPVFAHLPQGAWSPLNAIGDAGGMSVHMTTKRMTALVGMYSGRISDESDLGYVWKARLIDEIVQGGVPGTPRDDILGA